jgi:hypothetical protein
MKHAQAWELRRDLPNIFAERAGADLCAQLAWEPLDLYGKMRLLDTIKARLCHPEGGLLERKITLLAAAKVMEFYTEWVVHLVGRDEADMFHQKFLECQMKYPKSAPASSTKGEAPHGPAN